MADGNIFSSLSDYLSGNQIGNAQDLYANAVNRVQSVPVPDLQTLAAQLREQMLANQISPAQYQAAMQAVVGKMQSAGIDTTALQESSGMNNVKTDASTLADARGNIQKLQEIGNNNGLTNADQAQYASIIAQNDAAARSANEAALDREASQGTATSGTTLAARLANNQGAANRNAAAGADVATSAQSRALDALKASLSGNTSLNNQLYTQDAAKATAQDEINKFNTSTKNSVSQFNSQQEQAARLAEYQAAQEAAARNAQAQNTANQFNATSQNDINKTNQTQVNNANRLGYDAAQDSFTNMLGRESAAAGIGSKAADAAYRQGNTQSANSSEALGSLINGAIKGGKAIYDNWDTISDAAGSAWDTVSGWFSDEDLKTGKRKLTDEECDKMMEHITGYKYKYKGNKDNPEQAGVMAQDLEKSGFGGKKSVIDTPAGKMVQGRSTQSDVLAVLANQAERIRRLESEKKKK